MNRAWIVLVTACGSGASGPDLTISTSFPVTTFVGANPSPLDPLMGQTIAFEVAWPTAGLDSGGDGNPQGCHSTGVFGATERAASGATTATTATVTTEILDPLPDWEAVLQLCTTGRSSVTVTTVIDRLNLGMTCFGLPPSALAMGSNSTPVFTSFTATMCQATILDVINNRTIGNSDFEITFATRDGRLPK
jgi:hypothetical protein